MPARDDYILRFIELIRVALSEAMRLREQKKYEQALIALVHAQEKLFARPTAEFIGLPIDEQLRLLNVAEPPAAARAKSLGYASLIREAGLVYQDRDRPDLAASAFQLALHVVLSVAVTLSEPDEQTQAALQDLLSRVPPDQLQEPVKELLQRYATGE